VPFFRDADDVYAFIGKVHKDLIHDDEIGPTLRRANTVVQYRYLNPKAQITVVMSNEEDPRVDFGDTDLEPEIVFTSEADLAHRFWLGEVNITLALARGQMRLAGPGRKVLKLVPLVKPVFPRYRAELEQAGRLKEPAGVS
jgi:hypothetical protein